MQQQQRQKRQKKFCLVSRSSHPSCMFSWSSVCRSSTLTHTTGMISSPLSPLLCTHPPPHTIHCHQNLPPLTKNDKRPPRNLLDKPESKSNANPAQTKEKEEEKEFNIKERGKPLLSQFRNLCSSLHVNLLRISSSSCFPVYSLTRKRTRLKRPLWRARESCRRQGQHSGGYNGLVRTKL